MDRCNNEIIEQKSSLDTNPNEPEMAEVAWHALPRQKTFLLNMSKDFSQGSNWRDIKL
ncbi:MAG: hypothetical protein HUU08_14295 [Candidatus Brocadia sp.]|nr:hypothetical protein [Candidatus Brocadia sp.]